MKVVYYRLHFFGHEEHRFSLEYDRHFWYVPKQRLILLEERFTLDGSGVTNRFNKFSLTTDPEMLSDARRIAKGERIIGYHGVELAGTFEYDDSKLRELIKQAGLANRIDKKTKLGIEALVSQSHASSSPQDL
jgi:hypothetical protein